MRYHWHMRRSRPVVFVRDDCDTVLLIVRWRPPASRRVGDVGKAKARVRVPGAFVIDVHGPGPATTLTRDTFDDAWRTCRRLCDDVVD